MLITLLGFVTTKNEECYELHLRFNAPILASARSFHLNENKQNKPSSLFEKKIYRIYKWQALQSSTFSRTNPTYLPKFQIAIMSYFNIGENKKIPIFDSHKDNCYQLKMPQMINEPSEEIYGL